MSITNKHNNFKILCCPDNRSRKANFYTKYFSTCLSSVYLSIFMYLNECSFFLCSHLSLTGGVVTAGLAIYDTIQVSVTSDFVWFLKLYEEHFFRMKLYEEYSLRMKLCEERAWKFNVVTIFIYTTSFFLQYIQPPVATWCVGQACSMGSLLLSAGAPGLRHALPHSRIMLHQPHGGAQVGETNKKSSCFVHYRYASI